MEKEMERRKSFRMPFISEVVCQIHATGKEYHGTLRDMSINGLFMETVNCPPENAVCEIEVILEGKHSRLMIDRLKGNVTRSEEKGVAIQFDERLEWVAMVPIYFHKMMEQFSAGK